MGLPTSMGFGSKLMESKAPEFRICCNVGSMFDLPNATLLKGKWGNTFLNGGLWNSTAIVGPNNSYKSTISKHLLLSLMANYGYSTAITMDTEISGTGPARYNELARRFDGLKEYDYTTGDRWLYVTNAERYGDQFWSDVKEYLHSKVSKENKKANTFTTPFVDSAGNYFKAVIPTMVEIDSLSQLNSKNVEERMDGLDAGDSKRNMEDMASAKAKSKIIRDVPVVTALSNSFFVTTAHVGEKKDLDPYSPSMPKFSLQKGNRTVKYVPETFLFNMNNVYEINTARPLQNATTKGAEFPRVPGEEFQGDKDLWELTLTILRGKGGSTGLVFPLLCSQTEGLLPSLSDFYFLKQNKFGFGGNDRNYYIELYPECSLSRTTVRSKIDSDPRLRRALRLQADLLLIELTHKTNVDFPAERICDPKTLYEDIKAKGYDWNELLDTINEWRFRDEKQDKPTLTIYDLLNIRAGEYTPYWHQDAWKKENKDSMAP